MLKKVLFIILSLGCFYSKAQQKNINLEVSVEVQGSNCHHVVRITPGVAGEYAYSIDAGKTFQSGNTFDGLCPGKYIVHVSNQNYLGATLVNIKASPEIDGSDAELSNLLSRKENFSGQLSEEMELNTKLAGHGIYQRAQVKKISETMVSFQLRCQLGNDRLGIISDRLKATFTNVLEIENVVVNQSVTIRISFSEFINEVDLNLMLKAYLMEGIDWINE